MACHEAGSGYVTGPTAAGKSEVIVAVVGIRYSSVGVCEFT
jgi:hypothetical protein